MRQTLLFVCLLCFATNAFGQEVEDPEQVQEPQKESSVFPEQDPLPDEWDFAIGFDAVPFAEYLGNFFNNTTNNSVGADFVGANQQLFGKYFLSDDMAVRGRLRLMQDISTDRNRVMQDNQQVPDPNVQVTDTWTSSSTFVRLGGGIEFRRGEGRLIGIYGGEASVLYGTNTVEYNYGNPITAGNPAPTSTPTFTQIVGGRFERLVEEKNNRQLGVGLNAFAGIEYFIAPKISVGAEFTLGVDFIKNYRQQEVYQFWNIRTDALENRRYVSEGGNQLTVFTGNYGGSINLMFYF